MPQRIASPFARFTFAIRSGIIRGLNYLFITLLSATFNYDPKFLFVVNSDYVELENFMFDLTYGFPMLILSPRQGESWYN